MVEKSSRNCIKSAMEKLGRILKRHHIFVECSTVGEKYYKVKKT